MALERITEEMGNSGIMFIFFPVPTRSSEILQRRCMAEDSGATKQDEPACVPRQYLARAARKQIPWMLDETHDNDRAKNNPSQLHKFAQLPSDDKLNCTSFTYNQLHKNYSVK